MRPLCVLALLLSCLFPAVVFGGALVDVEVFDRTAQRSLPLHQHRGRLYVAGEPRHQYELRLRSRHGGRLLAVTSVDGVNVVSGKTAAAHQNGYVLEPWGYTAIEGWRKSLDDVATFYFTRLRDSYAVRTGRPDHVGVIGVALFREQQPCCPERLSQRADEDASSADAARAQAPAGERRENSGLGTGHGRRQSSPASYVAFSRASAAPDETIVIYYDSAENLITQGVLPPGPHYARRAPEPFPGDFAPDPE